MSRIPLSERATDGEGNKQTGSSRVIEGVRFYSWRTGIARYESRTEDQRIRLSSNYRHTGYRISIDGEVLPKTFRYEKTAVKAALKHLSKLPKDTP